jgi:Flp pilus assembly pilin Flp
MTMKTYAAIAALAAIALLIGAFALPATVSEAYAQNTKFIFKQELSNRCSGSAICTNDAIITFG